MCLLCLHSVVLIVAVVFWCVCTHLCELDLVSCEQASLIAESSELLSVARSWGGTGSSCCWLPWQLGWSHCLWDGKTLCVPRFLIEGSLTSAPAGCDGSFSVSAWLGYGAQIFGPMLMWMFVWRCLLTKRESNVWSMDFEESGIFCNVDGPLFTWRPEQSKDWHPI